MNNREKLSMFIALASNHDRFKVKRGGEILYGAKFVELDDEGVLMIPVFSDEILIDEIEDIVANNEASFTIKTFQGEYEVSFVRKKTDERKICPAQINFLQLKDFLVPDYFTPIHRDDSSTLVIFNPDCEYTEDQEFQISQFLKSSFFPETYRFNQTLFLKRDEDHDVFVGIYDLDSSKIFSEFWLCAEDEEYDLIDKIFETVV